MNDNGDELEHGEGNTVLKKKEKRWWNNDVGRKDKIQNSGREGLRAQNKTKRSRPCLH